ncbi:DegT/DnrJ/EryC1/StrS family aminotransferase, partial [Psychrobacter sp. 1Y4]|uniref:DegT/DnrJ/EryC1/StrS family aminotransferase n=1 Tax=Psychrobacter sp. 1Y4 TaxID=3453575 RepID=UPI003F459699
GKSYAAVYETEQSPGYNWLHESFGTNWRMTELQGVIGRIQLEKMSEWTAKRAANAQAILEACSKWEAKGYLYVPRLEHLAELSNTNHAYYKLYVYVQQENLANGWTRDRIIEAINHQGVPCFSGSASEVYLEKAFDDTGLRPSIRLPMAKQLGESSLMFLVHPTLTTAEIEQTIKAIDTVFSSMVK